MSKSSGLFASTPHEELLAKAAADASSKATKPKKKSPRIGKLDGKPPPRPRGRHAVAVTADDAKREVVTIPVEQRLGFRPAEFAALIGVSNVTVWRGIRDGKIDVIDEGGIKIVPRSYAIRKGYLTRDAHEEV
jgi:hypothetical protein